MQKVYFFIGTKAQALKCVSLINLLTSEPHLSVVIVNSGQHASITKNIFKSINKKTIFLNLFTNKENISKYTNGFLWLIKFIFKYLIFRTIEKDKTEPKNICVIHGDTASTLMGLLWAKRNNCKILHLESGLTSKSILNPFPEEIIRRITAKFSDILVCFDSDSYKRLNSVYKNKYIFKVSENTILETLGNLKSQEFTKENLITATLHRTENIFSKKRLVGFIELLEKLSDGYTVNWYLHEPTLNSLKKFKIKISKKINLHNLIEHEEFIDQLKNSKVVVTDGGSIQEECFYLGKTTVIWRTTTERPYALNNNMIISNFNVEKSFNFILKNINKKINNKINYKSPSEEIYSYLKKNELLSHK